jgi:hypothetical protein
MIDGKATAILLGVWATFALDVFSTLNSSPQTTELFAGDREESLMHWVWIGGGVAVAGGVAGSIISKNLWPALGATLVAVGMMLTYRHAVARGQHQEAPA